MRGLLLAMILLTTVSACGVGEDGEGGSGTGDAASGADSLQGEADNSQGADAGNEEVSPSDPCESIRCEQGRRCDPETRLCEAIPAGCDILAQDCPDPDDRCTIVEDGSIGCVPLRGDLGSGQPCGAGGYDDCGEGTICAGAEAGGFACLDLCNVDTSEGCGGGQCCGGLMDVETAGVCTEVPPSCDALAQDCGDGMRCSIVSACLDTACVPDGTLSEGEECGSDGTDDCSAGLLCIGVCARFCDDTEDCPSGQTCNGTQAGAVGHCMGGH